jgi:hypothetical protein
LADFCLDAFPNTLLGPLRWQDFGVSRGSNNNEETCFVKRMREVSPAQVCKLPFFDCRMYNAAGMDAGTESLSWSNENGGNAMHMIFAD